ncbi:hypothetical protein KEM56_006755 [Ascosphaera pollenicola]|nr:hypothetical protein KEM56_006755 [Ascosphaera pollenicola]
MDEDQGFEYPVDLADIKKMLEIDISKITLCVILLNIMVFILISVDFAVRNDRSHHRPSAVERPKKGPCCQNCSRRSGECLRDKIPTREEVIYRAAAAALCAPAACLSARLADIENPRFIYLAGLDGVISAVYALWAGYAAGMRKLKLDELQSDFPDLEAGEDGRVKNM